MSDFKLDATKLDILTLDGAPDSIAIPADDIWYNYFGLQNANIITQYVKVNAPNLDLSQRGFPRADGVYDESFQWRQNRVKIKGTIKASSQTELETIMDAMRKAFAVRSGTLRTTWAGVARYYDDCMPVNLDSIFDTRDHYHINWCDFTMDFTSQHPFARLESEVSFDSPNPITVSPTNFVLTNDGTARTEPTIFVTAVTAGSLTQLTITNLANMESITIARAYADGDLIEINGANKTVKVNGSTVDYSGVLPFLDSGDNIVSLTMVGGGYSLSLTEQHYSRYY